MNRRGVVAAAGMALVGGCVGAVRNDGPADGEDTDGDASGTGEPSDTTPVAQFQFDARNSGATDHAAPPAGSVAWQQDLEIEPAAIVATDELVVAVRRGLLAYDLADGDRRWATEFHLVRSATPAVTPDTAYVPHSGPGLRTTGTPGIAAYALADGARRWHAVTDVHVPAPPTLGSELLVACGHADRVVALGVDPRTGDERWRTPIEEAAVPRDDGEYWTSEMYSLSNRLTAPAVAGGTVYVTSPRSPELVALDASDGSEQWRVGLEGEQDGPDAIAGGAPTVAGDTIYVGSLDGTVHAIGTDGETRWRVSPVDRVTGSIAIARADMYVPGTDALATLSDTGEQGWSMDLDGDVRPPAVTESAVVGADEKSVFACARDDGEVDWSHEPEPREHGDAVHPGRPHAPVVGEGTVVVTSDAGRLTGIE